MPNVGQCDLQLLHGGVLLVKLLAGVVLEALLVQHPIFLLLIIVILQQMHMSVKYLTILHFHHTAQLYDLCGVKV